MKYWLYALVLIAYTQPALGQSLHVDSTRFITGMRPGTLIQSALPTSDKGVLLLGIMYGNPGGIIPHFPLDTTFSNMLIVKLDSYQQIRWIKVYGGKREDGAASAYETPDGGFVVLGGTLSNDGDVTCLKGEEDIWLLRMDSGGNILWQKCYGDSIGGVGAMSFARTADSGFILLGNSNGYGYDVPFHYGGEFSEDWVVFKTDSLGNLQWSKVVGGTGNEQTTGSILAAGNRYYLISSTNSTDHDCTDASWHSGVNTLDDIHVLKLDDTGKVVWDRSYGGSGSDEVNYAFLDARDSSIVIVASTYSSDYMVPDCHGGNDIWILKLDRDGNIVFHRAFGTTDDESGIGICYGPNGGYLACGVINGVIGGSDGWILSIDSNGNHVTNKVFGGTEPDRLYSIINYLEGYIAIGLSGSKSFTEGTTYGNFDTSALYPNGGGAFVSYISEWPLSVASTKKDAIEMVVYPNPAKEKINVNVSDNSAGKLLIINSVGQTVYMQTAAKTRMSINILTWPSGIYCVLWKNADGITITRKLIKN